MAVDLRAAPPYAPGPPVIPPDRSLGPRPERRPAIATPPSDPHAAFEPVARVSLPDAVSDRLAGRILDGETIHVGVEGDGLSINGVPNDFAKGRAALN